MSRYLMDDKLIHNMFGTTLSLPVDSFLNLVVSDSDKYNIRISRHKEEVLDFIKDKKDATSLEIGVALNIGLNEVALILKELESEHKIIME